MNGMRPLTDDEVTRIAAGFTSKRDRALFFLGIRTGFRISELLSLKVGDVVQGGEIAHSVSVARRNMKGKIEGRTIPLHEEARAALEMWVTELNAAGATATFPLFLSRKGGAITRTQAWKVLTTAYSRAGVFGRLGTHGLRKTFASRVYERLGRDLIKTQRALGHKAITSTVAYLSFAESDVDAAIIGG
ncbi:MAG: hypothetical protein A2218_07830 [Elusimicrobia bacterium RIFOXYA2_FULL_53_38]|nr:MAG: hypothetical protein A2218_07830 [Elusimicrobia bacterium RIFOXYA2_FULL_53_38]